MDAHLRTIMRQWFHGHGPVPDVPPRPIYVFEGELGVQRDIQIGLLDNDGFIDLHTRLGWLNRNLDILRPYQV
jgi:hypothetical protein